jgi:hypothetical protein
LQIFTKISGLHKKDQKGARTVMSSTCKPAVMQSDQEEQEKAERRIGLDRRQFSYSAYIPERRTGQKRRKEAEAGKCPDGLSSQDIDE